MSKSYVHATLTLNVLVEVDLEARTVRHLRNPKHHIDEFTLSLNVPDGPPKSKDEQRELGKIALMAVTDWWQERMVADDYDLGVGVTLKADGKAAAAPAPDEEDEGNEGNLPN